MIFTEKKAASWLAVCDTISEQFSTCGKRQYGAIVLDKRGHVLGTGTNGSPHGYPHCVDGACPRLANNSPSGSAYGDCFAIHAESNALLYSDYSSRNGGTMVVNGPPCWGCTKLICNSGLTTLIYYPDTSYVDWEKCYNLFMEMNFTLITIPKPADVLVNIEN